MRRSLITGIILLIAIIMVGVMCTKKDNTGPQPQTGYKRTAVIEFFTYHDCPNCPVAEKVLDSLFTLHGDSILILEYHVKILGDTLSPCTTFVDERENRYSVAGYPTAVFDGIESNTGAAGDLFAVYTNILEDRFASKSDLKVQHFSASLVTPTSATFDVQIISQADLSGRLFFVLTEDSVVFGDSLYHFVTRQVYPDEDGMAFSVSEDDTFGTSGSIYLNWQATGDVWLNLFVQHTADNEIYQGASVNLGRPQIPAYQLDLTVTDTFLTVEPESIATFYLYLEHTGTTSDEYEMVAAQADTVPGWMWLMCSGSLCYPPAPTIVDTNAIDPGSVDTFDIKVHTNATPGIETINVTFTSLGDVQEIEAVTFTTEVQ